LASGRTGELARSDPGDSGIRRRRRGRGFSYLGPDGTRVSDPQTLARIRALVIPPAWEDVWICVEPDGHLQAIGTDSAGRRQYRYHDRWREQRDRDKHDRVLEFGTALPRLRDLVGRHLDGEGLTRERVLAAAIRLIDLGFFRSGGEAYAEENGTFGLATIRKEHVSLHKGQLRFEYTAKDFRTWHATVLAAVGLAVSGPAADKGSTRKRAIARTVHEVADYLGNTPAVARASYIDPRVIELYERGVTVASVLGNLGRDSEFGELATGGRVESAVVKLLRTTVAAGTPGMRPDAGLRRC
jgi:DNA topoisomerase I